MGQRLVHMASVGEDSVQHKSLSFLVRVTGDRVASGLRQWSNLGLDRERTVPEAPVLFSGEVQQQVCSERHQEPATQAHT